VATEYHGGLWYDGRSFVPGTRWVSGTRLLTTPPADIDERVDLYGGYVVPPYAEGHTHWLESALADAYVAEHLRAGIYYVKDHDTAPSLRARMSLGGPASVDYVAANQGFTAPEGHPFGLFAQLVSAGILSAADAADAVFAVVSEADVDRVWDAYLRGRPDFAKVFAITGNAARQGLAPDLVPYIVRRAHAAGLRVSAHIESAADFAIAVASGVDDIAHLPFVSASDPESYRLADSDVRAAGVRGMTVATTLQWLDEGEPDVRLDVTRDNIARLRAAGATLVVGTDLFRVTARREADLLARYDLLSNADLLRAWCVDTPRACLVPAGLSDFLVLGGDPLRDFAATADIRLRVKGGEVLVPGAAAFP
jgi:imidazolonepropionase-like amidohydrolase